MLSLTRVLSAASGSSPAESDSWQMNRRRVRAWRAEPAWIVVKPFTPDDSVSSSGSASRSRTSPTMATSGAMRRKPGHEPAEVDGRAVGTRRHGSACWRRSGAGRRLRTPPRRRRPAATGRARRRSTTAAWSCRSPAHRRRRSSAGPARRRARNRGGLGGQHVPLDELVEACGTRRR